MVKVYCKCCGQPFETKSSQRKYCSDACRETMARIRNATKQYFLISKDEPEVGNTCPRDCKYRGRMSRTPCCDYILIKKEPRGCDITECDKYEKGKKKKGWEMPVPGMKR